MAFIAHKFFWRKFNSESIGKSDKFYLPHTYDKIGISKGFTKVFFSPKKLFLFADINNVFQDQNKKILNKVLIGSYQLVVSGYWDFQFFKFTINRVSKILL